MGGFGFFFDNVVRAIVKNVRREKRASTAENWPIVDAKVAQSSCGGVSKRPVVTYSYAVNGETWYGTCVGHYLGDTEIEKARSALSAIPVFRVRYDPSDPAESRVLNRDNPKLPFQVNRDPY